MKKIIIICIVTVSAFACSCNSENKRNDMTDSLSDTSMIYTDTSSITDTAGIDSMYRDTSRLNQPGSR